MDPARRSGNRTRTSIRITEGNEVNEGSGGDRLFVLFVVFCSKSAAFEVHAENNILPDSGAAFFPGLRSEEEVRLRRAAETERFAQEDAEKAEHATKQPSALSAPSC
jgi:hypothetical protein